MTVLTRSMRVVEAELVVYRRTWRGTVISSFVNPVLFLSAMGLSLGSLVDSSGADLGMSYLTFVASGLIAATAMQSGAGEGAFPVMAGIKWRKEFHATITTPLGPADIVYGRFLWSIIRLAFILVVFAVISVLFGALEIGPALLAVPPGILTGVAFTTVVTAFTVTREDEQSLSTLFRFAITPLFLFSGTFFPISQLPDFLQKVAYVTPLFHGVELVRKIAIPGVDESAVTSMPIWVHVVYLTAMTVSVSAPSRLTPPRRMTPFRAQRIWERNTLVYRRLWKIIFTGFFEPVFYLFSIGIGIGALVGDVTLPNGVSIEYPAFVAPALMAASAMNGAVLETTFNIFFRLKFGNVYEGILTTPLVPRDIAIGEIGWALLRGAIYSTVFLVVMALMGLTESWWAVMTVPGAVLIGFCFGSLGMAATTYMRSWQDLDLVALVTMPLFLFSATFYPLDVYPPAIQQIARISPLYHGTEMLRAFSLGIFDWTLAGHVAFLVVLGLVGARIASRRLDGLLRK